jgi:hypothetical protein
MRMRRKRRKNGTFTSSCTAALFWEFMEFASDVFLHTTVQQSLSETMLDLVFGVLGALSSLTLVAFARLFLFKPHRPLS